MLPFLHGSNAARLLEAQGAPDEASRSRRAFRQPGSGGDRCRPSRRVRSGFPGQLLTLSPDAAAMAGLPAHKATLSHSDWMARLHPEDREIYRGALEQFRDQPGQAFRLEFRAQGANGAWRWLELRATIVTDQDVPSDCLGLISDITDRKEAAPAAGDRLTGLGGRLALMDAHGGSGRRADDARNWRCWISTGSRQFMPASAMPAATRSCSKRSHRLNERFGREAQIFRDRRRRFRASVCRRPRCRLRPLGDELIELCNPPHPYEGRNIFAPASVGVASQRGRSRPAAAQCRAGALRRQGARRRLRHALCVRSGGGCARRLRWRWKPICARRWTSGQIEICLSTDHAVFRSRGGRFRGACCAGGIPPRA